jgi:hypothetical protein
MCLWSQPSENVSLKMLKIDFFFTFLPRISIGGAYLHVSVNLTFNLEKYRYLHRSTVQLLSIQFFLFSFTFGLT